MTIFAAVIVNNFKISTSLTPPSAFHHFLPSFISNFLFCLSHLQPGSHLQVFWLLIFAGALPSPNELINKVLVKAKRLPPGKTQVVDKGPCQGWVAAISLNTGSWQSSWSWPSGCHLSKHLYIVLNKCLSPVLTQVVDKDPDQGQVSATGQTTGINTREQNVNTIFYSRIELFLASASTRLLNLTCL